MTQGDLDLAVDLLPVAALVGGPQVRSHWAATTPPALSGTGRQPRRLPFTSASTPRSTSRSWLRERDEDHISNLYRRPYLAWVFWLRILHWVA